jgi:hypothetical protein
MKKYKEAVEHFKSSVTMLESVTDKKTRSDEKADLFYMIGMCYEKLNEAKLSFKNYQSALKYRS